MNRRNGNPYRTARDRKLADLKKNPDPARFRALGAEVRDTNLLILPLLRWRCRLAIEPFSLCLLPEGREMEMTDQVLVLDYLTAANPTPPHRMISFADFPEARGYLDPYRGRVLQRLTHTAGVSEESFTAAALRAGGQSAGSRPARFMFRFFPLFELQVARYEADEDFPHSCNMLFSDNALSVLSVESVIVCAERLVSVMQGNMP